MPTNLNDFLPETAVLIGKDLGIVPLSAEQATDYGILRQWLADVIDDLLQNNHDYLRWVLYRLDVSQNKAKQAFQQVKRYDTALQLADLVIERECQKAQTRQWYRNRTNSDSDSDNDIDNDNTNSNEQDDADRW